MTLKISKLYVLTYIFLFYISFIFSTFSSDPQYEPLEKLTNAKALVLWVPTKAPQEILYEQQLQSAWETMKASNRLQRFGRGEVIFLYGISSAGKTSICNELKRICSEWSFESLDKSIDSHLVTLLHRLFPRECRLIAGAFANDDIVSVIFEGKGHFRKSISILMQKKATEACLYIKKQGALIDGSLCIGKVKQEMYERAFLKSQMGQPVVIDTTGFQEFITYKEQYLFNCPIRYILVHCPFSIISERMARRNREAELKNDTPNMRYGTHPFFQFAKLYKVSTKTTESVIERVSRKIVIKSFDFNFDEDTRKFPPEASTLEIEVKRITDKRNLLEKLGFCDSNVKFVHLTPRFYYDFILDTHVNSSYAYARLIGSPRIL